MCKDDDDMVRRNNERKSFTKEKKRKQSLGRNNPRNMSKILMDVNTDLFCPARIRPHPPIRAASLSNQ